MGAEGLHRDLELRLEALAERIAALRQKMKEAKGAARIEEFGEISELEQRYQALADQLRALNREGPGLRQNAHAELDRLANDLSGSVEDFTQWVDSGYRGTRPFTGQRKP